MKALLQARADDSGTLDRHAMENIFKEFGNSFLPQVAEVVTQAVGGARGASTLLP